MYMLYNIGIYSSSAKEEWCFSVACRKQNKERMKWSIWAYTYYIGTNFRTQETQANVGGWSCLYHIMKHILYWLPVLRWKETFLFLSWNNSLYIDISMISLMIFMIHIFFLDILFWEEGKDLTNFGGVLSPWEWNRYILNLNKSS